MPPSLRPYLYIYLVLRSHAQASTSHHSAYTNITYHPAHNNTTHHPAQAHLSTHATEALIALSGAWSRLTDRVMISDIPSLERNSLPHSVHRDENNETAFMPGHPLPEGPEAWGPPPSLLASPSVGGIVHARGRPDEWIGREEMLQYDALLADPNEDRVIHPSHSEMREASGRRLPGAYVEEDVSSSESNDECNNEEGTETEEHQTTEEQPEDE